MISVVAVIVMHHKSPSDMKFTNTQFYLAGGDWIWIQWEPSELCYDGCDGPGGKKCITQKGSWVLDSREYQNPVQGIYIQHFSFVILT